MDPKYRESYWESCYLEFIFSKKHTVSKDYAIEQNLNVVEGVRMPSCFISPTYDFVQDVSVVHIYYF